MVIIIVKYNELGRVERQEGEFISSIGARGTLTIAIRELIIRGVLDIYIKAWLGRPCHERIVEENI